jgi:hypothetical protein
MPAGRTGRTSPTFVGLWQWRWCTASPDDPVESWPFEGILAAVERGTLPDWRRLVKVIQSDPWGPVAQQVLEAIRLSHPYGTAELLEGAVGRARKRRAPSGPSVHGTRVRSSANRPFGAWPRSAAARYLAG